MKILAIDSSGTTATVAIATEHDLVAEYTIKNKQTHSQTLLPMIDEMVKTSGTELDSIDAIAVAAGPGSFTGLRIGSATAKGLALALDKPIVAVPTLAGLAYNLWGTAGIICPIMDARRSQVYAAAYTFENGAMVEVIPQAPLDIDHLMDKLEALGQNVTFVGDGIAVYGERIKARMPEVSFAPVHMREQKASSVAALGLKKLAAGETVHGDDFAPEYLRLSQAERVRLEQEGKL